MTELRWITTAQTKEFLSATSSPYPKDVLQQALDSAPTAQDDEQLALLALREGQLAGWMWFTYGYFSDDGTHVRVASAQNHYTYDKFRGLGIGTAIIVENLKLPMHCVFSGISAAAMPIYVKLGFHFFDEWPIFRLPLGGLGMVRNWRSEHYARGGGIGGALGALRHVQGDRQRVVAMQPGSWRALDGARVVDALGEIARYRHRRFQMPWNLDAVDAAARGRDESMYAFVLENAGGERRYASIYVREESVRMPLSRRQGVFRDGHVNEIYPPVEDVDTARALVAELARLARARGLGCLTIYASTPALEEALTAWGQRRQQRRN
ncbi:MAG: hypothetical protein AB7I32_12575, partial [Gammaproteobacteria bacterium]